MRSRGRRACRELAEGIPYPLAHTGPIRKFLRGSLLFATRREKYCEGFTEDRRATPTNKKPTGCLLGACSGQHPMGYRFSLLTLLFSGVCRKIRHHNPFALRLIL